MRMAHYGQKRTSPRRRGWQLYIKHKLYDSYADSSTDSLILTATPSFASYRSVRTMSPRQISLHVPAGLRICIAKLMRSPAVTAPLSVQKNTLEGLTSRVIPVPFSRITGSAVRTRESLLFSCSVISALS